MQNTGNTVNSNESINWNEEAISKKHIKSYEYKYFGNFQEIGSGKFGMVYSAKWKNSDYLALKSFFNLDDSAVKELIHEVITNNNIFSLF